LAAKPQAKNGGNETCPHLSFQWQKIEVAEFGRREISGGNLRLGGYLILRLSLSTTVDPLGIARNNNQ
jgi:hypothetical protein